MILVNVLSFLSTRRRHRQLINESRIYCLVTRSMLLYCSQAPSFGVRNETGADRMQ